MNRDRNFTSLHECVNPIYHKAWGHCVTVKHAIDVSFYQIEQRAYRIHSKFGYLNIVIPNLRTHNEILQYLYTFFLRFTGTTISVVVGSAKRNRHDIVVKFVPLTRHKRKYAIPVGWCDNIKDYTWQQVLDNGQHYSSSSTDVWPPHEYKIRAQIEKVEILRKQVELQNGLLN